MNVLNVYSATGNADDDGYLAADEWQSNINDKLIRRLTVICI
ncbi:MAG: hypothetical protein U5L09_03735 [Bacteroidales bacterium]|nr:hypothetical protein [Bacteroidales bacterium]